MPATVTELRFQAGTSNKFYRVYTVEEGSDAFLVCNWGRWGAKGQFKVERADLYHARQLASRKISDKQGKGYSLLRDTDLAITPPDILDIIEQQGGVSLVARRPAPASATPEAPTAAVNLFDVFAADTDRLIRMVTSSPDLTSEAVVLRSTLAEQLANLRTSVSACEGQLELIEDVIRIKAGV